MRTGYPVMVVLVVAATDEFFRVKRGENDDIRSVACMMTARNNKMKYLIAIYF